MCANRHDCYQKYHDLCVNGAFEKAQIFAFDTYLKPFCFQVLLYLLDWVIKLPLYFFKTCLDTCFCACVLTCLECVYRKIWTLKRTCI